MLLLGRAVAPGRFAPEASVAPAGVTDRKAVENVYGVTGRKHEVEDPLLDQGKRHALPGEGLVGSEVRKEDARRSTGGWPRHRDAVHRRSPWSAPRQLRF